jgi:hypothetical protein
MKAWAVFSSSTLFLGSIALSVQKASLIPSKCACTMNLLSSLNWKSCLTYWDILFWILRIEAKGILGSLQWANRAARAFIPPMRMCTLELLSFIWDRNSSAKSMNIPSLMPSFLMISPIMLIQIKTSTLSLAPASTLYATSNISLYTDEGKLTISSLFLRVE